MSSIQASWVLPKWSASRSAWVGGMSWSSRALDDEDRAGEGALLVGPGEDCCGLGTLRRYLVRSRRTLGLWRSGPIQLPNRSSGNPLFGQGAEGRGEMADPAPAQQLGDQEGAAGQRRGGAQQPARRPGRIVVEGLTGHQDQVGDTIRSAGADDELRAAPVVADQRDPAAGPVR